MIDYYYTYLTNKFSLGTRNIYIYSVLEYALSKKSIIFLFLWKFSYEQKNCKTKKQKVWFFCINSSKIYKEIPDEKLIHFRSSLIPLPFLNINKNL